MAEDELSAVETILTENNEDFVDYQLEEDYFRISDEDLNKLNHLSIQLPFEPPIPHTIETRFTHVPTEEQKESLEIMNFKMRRGSFDPSEDAVLRRNWLSFSEEYDFDDPGLFFNLNPLSYSERRKFLQYLGNGLPERFLYSIFHRFQLLFRKFKLGSFTPEEDKVLMKYIHKEKNIPYAKLSETLNRSRISLYMRVEVLRSSKNKGSTSQEPLPSPRIVWTDDLIEEVVRTLLQECGVKKLKSLRNKHIPSNVWISVGAKCKIPPMSIKKFWLRKLSTVFFAKEPVVLSQLNIRLIQLLTESKVDYWQNLHWREIAEAFNGLAPLFLWFRLRYLLLRFVPRNLWMSLKDTLSILNDKIDIIQSGKKKDAKLRRLRWSKLGKLEDRNDEN